MSDDFTNGGSPGRRPTVERAGAGERYGDFTARTLSALAEAADEKRTQMLAEDLGRLPPPPLRLRARLRRWFSLPTLVAALSGALIAAFVIAAFGDRAPSEPSGAPPTELPSALSGGPPTAPPTSEWELIEDQGRIAELRPKTSPIEGQHLHFRGERLARIETYRGGRLHGHSSTCQDGTCVDLCNPSGCPSGVCLTVTQCAECSTDAQCGGATPLCLVAANRCVTCLTGTRDNCGPTAYCDATTYTCQRGCNFAHECNSGVCQANHQCVNCISEDECTEGNICNNGSCEPPCSASAPCSADRICCNGACTDRNTEINCHGCGAICTADQFCGRSDCTDLELSAICERSKVMVVTNLNTVDNEGGHAVGAALAADCGHPIELTSGYERDPAVLSQSSGAPQTDKDTLLIYSGHAFTHWGTRSAVEIFGYTKIYETTENGVDILIRDRTGMTIYSFSATSIGANHDYFIVEVAQTPAKQIMFLLYGMDRPGTRAAADWVIREVIPNRAAFGSAYYLVEWTDQNGDSLPNAPDAFEILLQE